MDTAEVDQRCNVLRKELKAWEKEFAAQHEGRKAGRDDIKANATISHKYKEYNKLRDILSGKSKPEPHTPSKRTATRKPARDADPERTPKARSRTQTTTPMKRKRDSGVDLLEDDEVAEEFQSPQGPSMIGPTPQRDGIVLGLFDLLPMETPSRRRTVLGEVEVNALQTPSKHMAKADTFSEAALESRARGERTPQSSGKRFMLDRFVTPKRRKADNGTAIGVGLGTPTSAFKGFSTPAFLRRDNFLGLEKVDEDDENAATPRPAPWKRRGLGRSLSAMIRNMKQAEEDRLDEELEMMREMEMEADGIVVARKGTLEVEKVQVEDSQVVMPLGPDRGLESEDEVEEEKEGKVRVWKKKGLKRQTRRVNMRPHFVKPLAPQPVDAEADSDAEAEAETTAEAAVAETQLPEKLNISEPELSDDGSDYASDASHTPKQRKKPGRKPLAEVKSRANIQTQKKEGVVKTAARKVAATAHANYRKLKIKGKGGGGGGAGGRGKFGRRR